MRRRIIVPYDYFFFVLLLLRLAASLVISSQTGSSSGSNNRRRSADLGVYMDEQAYSDCLKGLQTADVNGDYQVSQDEYPDFARFIMSDLEGGPTSDYIGNSSFDDLPTALQEAFWGVACICDEDATAAKEGEECCRGDSASIRIPTSSSTTTTVDNLSADERVYLYTACSSTIAAAKTILEESMTDIPTPRATPLWPYDDEEEDDEEEDDERPTRRTRSPSGMPRPTDRPSIEPVEEEDDEDEDDERPTRRPRNPSPTDRPSNEPNDDDKDNPIEAQSDAPSDAPSPVPTSEVTPQPTSEPTPTEPEPTSVPTTTISRTSPSPTSESSALEKARVEYFFNVPVKQNNHDTDDNDEEDADNDKDLVSYLSDLQVAMNLLAPQVVIHNTEDVEISHRGRTARRRRRNLLVQGQQQQRSLQASLSVVLPTTFGNIAIVDCPPTMTNQTICRWVLAVIPLEILLDENSSVATSTYDDADALSTTSSNEDEYRTEEDVMVAIMVEDFERRLSEAIAVGRLQDELIQNVNPNSPVTVYVSEDDSPPPPPTESPSDASVSTGLSTAAISGIVVAAAVVVLIPLIVFVMRPNKRRQVHGSSKVEQGAFYVGEAVEGDAVQDFDGDIEQPSCPAPPPPILPAAVAASATAYESRHVAPTTTTEATQEDDDDYEDNNDPTENEYAQRVPSARYLPGLAVSNVEVPTSDVDEKEERELSRGDSEWVLGYGSDGGGDEDAASYGWSVSEGVGMSSMSHSLDPATDGSSAAVATGVAVAGVAGVVAATLVATRQQDHEKREIDEEEQLQNVTVDSDAPESLAVASASSDDELGIHSSAMSSALDSPITSTQLEAQVEAGDWAAVGATAALLAAASDSQSGTNSRASRHSGGSKASGSRGVGDDTDEVLRVAELDRLVDKGDWDGLIVAAARFEAAANDATAGANNSNASTPRTGSSVSSGDAASGSDTGTGTIGSPSYETSVSDSQVKEQRHSELRSEIEALVRRVVPEEIDNVDEMMEQFKGREEELVETLRTMQERSIAHKARTAKQKAAKAQARRTVQRGVVPGTQDVLSKSGESETSDVAEEDVAFVSGASAPSALDGGQFGESQGTISKETADSIEQKRSALEGAIEAGDWQAVCEAAAMLSDVSMASGSTGDRYTDLNESGYSVRSLGGVGAERAAELDVMVGTGDWTGVMEAAQRFSEEDESKEKLKGPSKEEEEALQQAELWTKIAEQKKPGATDEGASSAAEWAIQRSFSQLNEAEKQNEAKTQKETGENNEEV